MMSTSDISMMMPTVTWAPWKPGERVEARAEQAGGEAEALPVERRELVDLAADEVAPSSAGGHQPQAHAVVVAAAGRRHGQHHRERAHQQHERAHRGEGDVVDLVRAGARRRCGPGRGSRSRSGRRRAGTPSPGTATTPACCSTARCVVKCSSWRTNSCSIVRDVLDDGRQPTVLSSFVRRRRGPSSGLVGRDGRLLGPAVGAEQHDDAADDRRPGSCRSARCR